MRPILQFLILKIIKKCHRTALVAFTKKKLNVIQIPEQHKQLDANKYATKKTIAQGMLDIALLTANASQLKYVLQLGYRHEFYQIMIVLISSSIVLQVSYITFFSKESGA